MKASGIFDYLNNIDTLLTAKASIKQASDLNCLKLLEQALATRAAFYVKSTVSKLNASQLSENEKKNSVFTMDIIKMAHAHVMYVTFKNFLSHIETHPYTCNNVKDILSKLARVYALTELLQDSVPLYETGFFSTGTYQILLDAQKENIKAVRPQMIPLVESFQFPDSFLNSAIGNSFGDIYET